MTTPDAAIYDIRQRLQQIHDDNRTAYTALGTKMDVLTQANAETQRTLGQLEAQSRALGRDVGTLAKRVEEHEGRLGRVEELHAEERGSSKKKMAGIATAVGAALYAAAEAMRQLFTTTK